MGIFISIAVMALAMLISLKHIGSGRAISLDRGAMLKAESKVVVCGHCQTKLKRQKYGQQCPKCRKYI